MSKCSANRKTITTKLKAKEIYYYSGNKLENRRTRKINKIKDNSL